MHSILKRGIVLLILLLGAQFLVSCSKKIEQANPVALASEKSQQDLADQIAELPESDSREDAYVEEESGRRMGPMNRASLIAKARKKRLDASLFRTNEAIIKANGKHTKIYPFTGKYKVMVIPVQFSDVKFEDPRFFKPSADGASEAQKYIFGKSKNTMTSYYKHVSLGNLKLEGTVTPIITIDKPLADFGASVPNSNDRNAPGLVIAALKKLKKIKTDNNWWDDFDQWDLSDYDKDNNFHEPDGFVDAVVLIYAGKSQASCQSSFDPDGKDPASDDVPPGPRHDATVECFNRIWPHRWSVNLGKDSPDYSVKGPVVEGRQRPAMNGLKINDHLFANDYNMQSEFSDRSTFFHEFGHSLSLPDVYSGGKGNSSGSWEVMSSNAGLQAQEMSSYSKITLGWLAPKIIKQGESTSAYLGAYGFVSPEQRDQLVHYAGPNLSADSESIVSAVPDSGESVFRSIMVITDASEEERKIVDFPTANGSHAAYTSRYNSESRSLTYNVTVPLEGDATFSFDTIYHIETETNFSSKEAEIKIVTDFDMGRVTVGEKELETLRIVSGDTDYDTLADLNPLCKQAEVLSMRLKVNTGTATVEEIAQYKTDVALCQKPIWTKKSYDLSEYRGKSVELKISYITDPGYTEFGIIVDNVKLPGLEVNDFEASQSTGEFVALKDGSETITFQQYYLMEYRDPKISYLRDGKHQSYNFDQNISVGSQSMFLPEGKDLLDKFRMVTFDYQPGVLVWYFNSKFDSGPSGNNPAANKGKGYLLVLNSKVKEVVLPGIFSDASFFGEDGHYLDEDSDENALGALIKSQRKSYICFSHTAYATYLNGEAPLCEGENGDLKDKMLDLTFKGYNLIHRRERFNETLPTARYGTFGVGRPFRTYAGVRTGLSTFRAPEAGEYKPFKVYKEENGEMVLDQKMTEESAAFAPISTFKDSDNVLSSIEDFHGDSVVVEKHGFSFQVAPPSGQILKRYSSQFNAEDNDTAHRAPKAKIYFDWE
ncbi:MAG: hypothetical protein HN509_13725 [Halobacteriovoraceae bacterium]|nr:hypothetical protein [Halobacteriovoraceae bacterium]MBT5095210.1 hypothetical protein [Halobacteriovoraceae bacterium]